MTDASHVERLLSNAPDPDPTYRFNYNWNMNDLQTWTQNRAEEEQKAAQASSSGGILRLARGPKAVPMFGGRVWWSAAGRLASIVVLFIAIVAQSLIILRDATADITGPVASKTLASKSKTSSMESAQATRLFIRALKESQSKDKHPKQPQCQWVHNTDVQNNGSGIALALSCHLLTTIVISVLILAEFYLWTHKLHASATLNIGLVQLWVGLSGLSRAVNDSFGQIAGYLLVIAGLGNIASGFMDRFSPGGPAYRLFGTGMNTQQLQQQQQQALPGAGIARRRRSREPRAPHPEEELMESEKVWMDQQAQEQQQQAAQFQQGGNLAQPAVVPTLPATGGMAQGAQQQQTAALQAGIAAQDPAVLNAANAQHAATGGVGDLMPAETKSLLDSSAVSSPAAYQQLMTQWASSMPGAPSGEMPVAAHRMQETAKRSSSKGKKWKKRMAHDL